MDDVIAFENALGVDFYNLKFVMGGNPNKYEERKAERFLHKYIYEPLLAEIDDDGSVGLIASLGLGAVYNYHDFYVGIVDKVLDGEKLSDGELEVMDRWLHGRLTQYQRGDRWVIGYDPMNWFPGLSLRSIYRFVYRLSNGEVKVGRCGLEGCDNIFLFTAGGKPRKYCSHACSMRAHRLRKKSAAEKS